MFAEKVFCISVSLYRLFKMTIPCALPRSSMTMRIPRRSDSSRISVMPSSRLFLTRAAIFSINPALLTWYGSSVTTICIRLPRFIGSISATARITIPPRPVVYAFLIPLRPMIVAPVGKSGPGISAITSSSVAFGWSMRWMIPSQSSDGLCGGMLVAMPTAMPAAPLTSKFGSRAGSTTGSCSEPSKLSAKSTVS